MIIIDDDEITLEQVCSECNNPIDSNQNNYDFGGGQLVHPECTFECNECRENLPVGHESHRFDGYCTDCEDDLFWCDRCDEVENENNANRVGSNHDNYDMWCDRCTDYNATYCERHGIHHRDGYRCGHDMVEPYDYKPAPVFYGVEFDHDYDRNLFMGFELEVECTEDNDNGTKLVHDELGSLVYFKEDGSLDDGFEIITHPMTLAYAQQMKWGWLNELIANGYRSWDTETCGLHVHVDKRAFTGRKHQYAFTLLLMRNRSLSYLISGRQDNHYAQFDKDVRLEIPKYMKNKPNNLQRYSAVNVLNRATIEVRMFKGSLKRERILAALEYVHSAVDYSRDVKSGNTSKTYLTSPAFIQWIRANETKYPNLTKYINDSTEFGFNDKARVYVDYRGE